MRLDVPSRTVQPTTSIEPLRIETRADSTEVKLPMMQQLDAPLQNAASPRTIYPDAPAAALLASLESRRSFLLGRTMKDQPLPTTKLTAKEFISASLPETR